MNSDKLHPYGEQKDWNESFYFNWYDQKHGICCFTRIGHTPNIHQKNMFLFFMLPDGKKLGIRKNNQIEDKSTGENLIVHVDELTFKKITNEKEWNLQYDGTVSNIYQPKDSPLSIHFDLTFRGIHPIFNYRDCPITPLQEKLSKNVASEHLEQCGEITGTLTIEDQTYEINALGERDHSWGVRNWTAPKQWIWLTGQFNKEFAFNVTKLSVAEGDIDAGFIHSNNKTYPIKQVTIDTSYNTNHEPTRLHLSIKTTLDNVYDIQAIVKDRIHVPFHNGENKSMMYENLAEYTYKDTIGYGIAEYLVKQ